VKSPVSSATLPLLLVACGCACCGQTTSVCGYEFGAPSRSLPLPHALREVSGIVALDAHTVACVQDEKGRLFFVDMSRGQVEQRVRFGPDGDYEGLAQQGDGYWALRSDGELLQLRPDGGGGLVVARRVRVQAAHAEFEGLCWDPRSGLLLVAPKSRPEDGDVELRPLYAVDPATGATQAQPFLTLDRGRVLAAARRLGVKLPIETDHRGRSRPTLRLHWSEVAVDPRSGNLWLLSGVDRAVVVVDRAGAVLGLHVFAADELPQPEGITFLPDGELVLASEAAGGTAVLRCYAPSR
jgi:uncharacterized protein YjiK